MPRIRELIDRNNLPRHIAIIMDGNGRWAEKHSLSRIEGHRKGAEAVEPVIDMALELGLRAVSLYAFSTENWKRPGTEIRGLWNLLDYFFTKKLEKIKSQGIQIRHSGSVKRLPRSSRDIIGRAVAETKTNKKLVLNFCLNYGGRQEIVDAVNAWLDNRKRDGKISKKELEKYLYTSGLPGIDLMIRTSGEYRTSNFFVWQLAYSELFFTDVLWPDFTPDDLCRAIYEYQQRIRRYGGL